MSSLRFPTPSLSIKRRLCSLAAAMSLAFGVPSLACENGEATISGGTNYPPLSWRQGDVLVGATIEMVRQIMAEVGVKARADQGGPWKRVLVRAETGEVDILMGVRKAPDRAVYLSYVEPAITPSVQGVFVAAGSPLSYTKWDDLKGKSGSMTLGTNFNDEFDEYMHNNLHVELVPRVEQNFMKLERGRVDYILGPLVPTQLYLQKYGFKDKIHNAEMPLMTIDEFVAISKKSSCMKHYDHVQKRVREYVESGKLNELMESYFVKWFEEEAH